VLLLESGGILKGSSNLLSRTRIQGLDLREGEREELKLWISRRVLLF
jgi:hypothetical protein